MRSIILAELLAATGAAAQAQSSSWTVGQEVRTVSGLIKGHAAVWPVGSEVSEYLGIPYAKPPIGPLRWAPPQLYKSDASFTADKYVCIRVAISLADLKGTNKDAGKVVFRPCENVSESRLTL